MAARKRKHAKKSRKGSRRRKGSTSVAVLATAARKAVSKLAVAAKRKGPRRKRAK